MNGIKSLELMKKYQDCPKCGSSKLDGGCLKIESETMTRGCSCGWEIVVHESELVLSEINKTE